MFALAFTDFSGEFEAGIHRCPEDVFLVVWAGEPPTSDAFEVAVDGSAAVDAKVWSIEDFWSRGVGFRLSAAGTASSAFTACVDAVGSKA